MTSMDFKRSDWVLMRDVCDVMRKPRDACWKQSGTHSGLSHAACPIEILCQTLWWITAIMSLRVL
jgi:hypothetical protein